MTSIEIRLTNIERMLKRLVEVQQPAWITEAEAMRIIGRGKDWLKRQRLGIGDIPATLIEGTDWRRINGRTPEYKLKSIEQRKLYRGRKSKNLVEL